MKNNIFINVDCMQYMNDLSDNAVDLILTDPPYGIGAGKGTEIYLSNNGKQDWKGKSANDHTIYGEWDSVKPAPEVFDEMKRVSKNMIVWGGNYFVENLESHSCWIVWNKLNGESFFADGELAYTTFDSKLRIFNFLSCGFMGSHKNRDTRYHPTQKPVPLFEWCLHNYSKENDLILDPFCGSGTTALACHRSNRRFICLDKEAKYIEVCKKRYREESIKTSLFYGSQNGEESQNNNQQMQVETDETGINRA